MTVEKKMLPLSTLNYFVKKVTKTAKLLGRKVFQKITNYLYIDFEIPNTSCLHPSKKVYGHPPGVMGQVDMDRSVPGSVGAPAMKRTMSITSKRFFIHGNNAFPVSDVMLPVYRILTKLVYFCMSDKQEKVRLLNFSVYTD